MPDKRLRLTWETFRDRLTPGQQEEWRLTVKNPDGTPADASLMAVLYDKSLDQIRQHQWDFSPNSYRTMLYYMAVSPVGQRGYIRCEALRAY